MKFINLLFGSKKTKQASYFLWAKAISGVISGHLRGYTITRLGPSGCAILLQETTQPHQLTVYWGSSLSLTTWRLQHHTKNRHKRTKGAGGEETRGQQEGETPVCPSYTGLICFIQFRKAVNKTETLTISTFLTASPPPGFSAAAFPNPPPPLPAGSLDTKQNREFVMPRVTCSGASGFTTNRCECGNGGGGWGRREKSPSLHQSRSKGRGKYSLLSHGGLFSAFPSLKCRARPWSQYQDILRERIHPHRFKICNAGFPGHGRKGRGRATAWS